MNLVTFFRGIIGDSTSPYTLPDARVWAYLDLGIDKLSQIAPEKVVSTVTITEADITAGYVTLPFKAVGILDFDIIGDWQQVADDRINLIENNQAGTFTIEYRRMYKKFDGITRLQTYFDYPERAAMGILYYALAAYQDEKGIINVDGATDFVRSKSEDGLSVTYGTMGAGEVQTMIGHPEKLKTEAIRIFQNLPHAQNILFSVGL